MAKKFDVTTTPGLKARSGRGLIDFRIEAGGIAESVALLNRGTERMDKNMAAVHARKLAKLNRLAREHFYSSIMRTGKENFGSRSHVGRQKFTFSGVRQGGAFSGVIFGPKTAGNRSGLSGFGYPDRKRADRVTDRAWRVAEFGLPASEHILPEGFFFKDPEGKVYPPVPVKRVPNQNLFPGRKREGKPRNRSEMRRVGEYEAPRRRGSGSRQGKGVPPMHFLQDAWDELFSTDETLSDYRDAVFEAFKGKK